MKEIFMTIEEIFNLAKRLNEEGKYDKSLEKYETAKEIIIRTKGENHPDLLKAALIAESSGVDNITVHLREDRRHINEDDISASDLVEYHEKYSNKKN